MTEILREPGRVANGLSTITARLTAENDAYIASITGGMGVIDKNTGELRSTYDILHDLADAWDNLTSVEKQELAETVARQDSEKPVHCDYDKFRHGSRGN